MEFNLKMLFLQANIKPTKTVYLWLGANVMLEYTLEDAEKLLTTNVSKAKENLSYIQHDLDFVWYENFIFNMFVSLSK